MTGIGFLLAGFAIWGLILLRRGTLVKARWFNRLALIAIALPYLANSLGWIFTEMGRQPWVVYGLLRTANGVSKAVSGPMVLATLIGFTIAYGGLALVDGWLTVRFVRLGAVEEESEPDLVPGLVY
jgi:cytochrome d ubiquinol oxidase subunit I